MSSIAQTILRSWPFIRESLQFVIEIGLLTAIIYMTLLFLKGTRAEPILVGIAITILGGWLLSQLIGLEVIEWGLAKLPALMVFALLIIFQPEIRRAFAEIGINPHRLIRGSQKVNETIDVLVEASYQLAGKHIGALIAIERDIGMRTYTDAGVPVHAPITPELLTTIFTPNTPLHDGACIVKNGILVAAACYFPLTQTPLSRTLGTRHRAAIGITEETDAVVIVVSEQQSAVSLAHKGRLVQNIESERLRRHLTNYLLKRRAGEFSPTSSLSVRNWFNQFKEMVVSDDPVEGNLSK